MAKVTWKSYDGADAKALSGQYRIHSASGSPKPNEKLPPDTSVQPLPSQLPPQPLPPSNEGFQAPPAPNQPPE
jgi:hypothetical protein